MQFDICCFNWCCSDEHGWRELNECLSSNDESIEESKKLAFICSCVVDSVKAGGSVLIPLNQLGIVLQLLEQIPNFLESSAVKVKCELFLLFFLVFLHVYAET